jgi:hypothetical protein
MDKLTQLDILGDYYFGSGAEFSSSDSSR